MQTSDVWADTQLGQILQQPPPYAPRIESEPVPVPIGDYTPIPIYRPVPDLMQRLGEALTRWRALLGQGANHGG